MNVLVLLPFCCALLHDTEALVSGCEITHILNGQAAKIRFLIPEGVSLEDDPDLFIHIRRDANKADILRCEREHISSNITCVVLDSRFQYEGMNGRNLNLRIKNATQAMEGVYFLRIVFNGEFIPLQSCKLNLPGNTAIKPWDKPGQNELTHLWLFALMVSIILIIVLAVLALHYIRRTRRSREKEKQSGIQDNTAGLLPKADRLDHANEISNEDNEGDEANNNSMASHESAQSHNNDGIGKDERSGETKSEEKASLDKGMAGSGDSPITKQAVQPEACNVKDTLSPEDRLLLSEQMARVDESELLQSRPPGSFLIRQNKRDPHVFTFEGTV